MDKKGFISGVFCGAMALQAWHWIQTSTGSRLEEQKKVPSTATVTPSRVQSGATELDFESSLTFDESEFPSDPDESVFVITQEFGPQPVIPQAGDPPMDSAGQPIDVYGGAYYMAKKRDELEEEPKDDAWAYYMEESIAQGLASHASIGDFELAYIECRTRVCQIQVIGYDDSTGPTWNRIMYDLRAMLPDDLYEWGTSSYDLDGRLGIVQTMKRAIDMEDGP